MLRSTTYAALKTMKMTPKLPLGAAACGEFAGCFSLEF
jgi:hypothetical protein